MFYAIDPEQRRIEPTPKANALCPSCKTDVRAKCGKVVTWHWAHVERECDHFSEPMTAWHKAWQETVPENCREVVIGPHRADILSPLGVVVELQHSSISVDEIREREEFYGQMVWVFDVRDATNADAIAEAKRTNALRQQRYDQLYMDHDNCEECLQRAQTTLAHGWYPRVSWVSGAQQLVMFRSTFDGLSDQHINKMLHSEGLVYREPPIRLAVGKKTRPDGSVMFWWKHPRKSLAACQRTVYLDLGQERLLRMNHIDTLAPCDGHGHLMQKSEFVNLINGRAASQ